MVRSVARRWRRVWLASILVLVLMFGWVAAAAAYNGYVIAGATGCDQGYYCVLTFYVWGGSDQYDCMKANLYTASGSYQTTGDFCRSQGWQQVIFYNYSPGSYWVLYYWDSPQQVSSGPYY